MPSSFRTTTSCTGRSERNDARNCIIRGLKPIPRKVRSAEQARAILEEVRRRGQNKDILASAFDKQLAFIKDPCRLKAACCTRRAGKTFVAGLYMFYEALTQPGCNVLYLALTRAEAKRIVLKDVFKDIDRMLGGTGMEVNLSELTLTFPNGSVIHIDGADSSERRHHMLTGKKYRLVVIDEAQFWKTSLFNLIRKGLAPAMADVRGTICLIGVPDNAKNFFYDVTSKRLSSVTGKPLYPGWSVHSWSAHDNPHMARQWQEDLDEILKNDPLFMETPTFFQQYLGQWVDDPEARCYRFNDSSNRIAELPGLIRDYTWVLGVDVGYKPDPMAIVVCGYRNDNSDRILYFTHAFKKVEMLTDEVGDYINKLRETYPISLYVIDGANGNVVGDLRRRLQIPFEKAQKHGDSTHSKRHYIKMMSDDMQTMRVKVVGDKANELTNEWLNLVWDTSQPEHPKEHSSCDNHCADAALYAWRRSFHYVKPRPLFGRPGIHSDQFMDGHEQRLAEQARNDANQVDEISQLEELFK